MSSIEPFYKYPVFTVKDTNFQYVIEKYDSDPWLTLVTSEETDGCGNPWNVAHKLGIRAEVLSQCPERNTLPDYKSKPSITIDFLSQDDCLKDITEYVGADCCLVYSTNDNRELQTTFYNSIDTDTDDHDSENRNKLMDSNATICLSDFDKNYTLNVIMNKFFIDIVYKRVPTTTLFTRTTVTYHTREHSKE